MPLLRYFVFVGGALLAVLLIVAAASPTTGPTDRPIASGGDVPSVRILSDKKWPERIVLDTTQAITTPPVVAQGPAAPKPAPADVAAPARARESLALLVPPDAKSSAVAKKPQPPKRKAARAHPAGRPMMMMAQQPRYGFGWFNTLW
jgi:hypothetical protein